MPAALVILTVLFVAIAGLLTYSDTSIFQRLAG